MTQRSALAVPRAALVAVVLVAALGGCTDAPSEEQASQPSATPEPTAAPSTSAAPLPSPDAAAPDLAEVPAGDVSLWLDTIGIPVVAAVRTSTPLADLADVAEDRRAATCRQVAADLDGIASPQVLTALAITADAETATLLVGDLQAKGDLLAVCDGGGSDLPARIAEVERTHAVAVAWLTKLRDGA